MAPGRQGPRKENDAGNRRFSVTSSEDVPVSGVKVPFEELLARELRKSNGNEAKSTANATGKTVKKPFLKKGARGWWMRQPDAKQKVVKHTLASKGDEDETAIKRTPGLQRRQQQQRSRSSSASSSKPLSPATTPPEQVQIAPKRQILSPPVSPIRRVQHNNQIDSGDDDVQLRRQQDDEFVKWKNASFRSTASTDIMGMKNVRRSYEAKQEREANEMAEFEAIERDLAAEKEAYLMEKQQQQHDPSSRTEPRDQIYDNQNTNDWGLPYSSFVSELHEQEQSRWQIPNSASIFDDSLDEEADSALVFDDHSALSKDDWMTERDRFTNQLRDHFGYGNHYDDPPSDLSAVSFDDSVPWDEGLSFQPQQSTAHEQPSSATAGGDLLDLRNDRDRFDIGPSAGQQAVKHGVNFEDHDDDDPNTLRYNKPGILDRVPGGDAPVSSLVQHVFGEYEGTNSVSPSFEGSVDSVGESSNVNGALSVNTPPPPPAQDKSLSTLKQKLRGKQKPPVPRTSTSKARGDGKRAAQVKAKPIASSRAPAKQNPRTNTGKPTQLRGQPAQSATSGMILPAVIEEKLHELEEEVKFYKSETLQLQKRKDYYDQEVKKLAIERDEFVRYQQEQRVLIEKEWERERIKMKKEEKLQERQWKLRINATVSHQDRKDRGEVEMLKAQIVKMQLDERARASKWKAENDNLRQRVVEIEEKNREQCDEIKFLEKDRLEQWEKYERLLKEKQEVYGSASKFGVTTSAAPSILSEKSELRTMDDVLAIKETADELLQRWSFPREDDSPNINEKEDPPHTASSGHHRRVQSSAVDDYNPKRYSLDREDSHPTRETDIFADESNAATISVNGFISDADRVQATNSATTYEWALPDAEDDDVSHSVDDASRKPGDGEGDGAISASTSSLSEHKTVTQEMEHPGGKKEIMYTDGSKKIIFPDGNEKVIDANGHVVIKFTNGDHKELFPDTGISVYYYYEAQTKLTTYPDNRKVYEFPNQQIEMSLPDGTTEIQFADGIKKTIRPNGDEFSVFPDGTTMLEQLDGLREVTLLNQKKIRYFPDGQMACVTPNGQETRVRSDSELKQLMENT